MGFRAAFLNHNGAVACHSEIVLHVFDRFVGSQPITMLLVGVDNGGSKQVWERVLPEGSMVVAVDERQECGQLDGVRVGRLTDRSWLEETLGNTMFDVIIDSMGHANGATWPWLKVGGFFIVEHYDDGRVKELMHAIVNDENTWLPYEEVLGVQYYPNLVVIEKRNPRVVPYLDIIVGQDAPIVDEFVYAERGGKRVTVPKETLENL